jgi:hypothetical protein
MFFLTSCSHRNVEMTEFCPKSVNFTICRSTDQNCYGMTPRAKTENESQPNICTDKRCNSTCSNHRT